MLTTTTKYSHPASSREETGATALVERCKLPVCVTTAVVQTDVAAEPRAWVFATEGGGRGQLEIGDVLMPMEVSSSIPVHPCPIPLSHSQG